MAHLKAHPKSFAQAEKFLGDRSAVKLGNNTWLERLDADTIGVQLHSTYVVRFHRAGATTLHTGGYYTVTTKDRINEFISGRVYQQAHRWYYVGHDSTGRLDWDNPVPFIAGMEV